MLPHQYEREEGGVRTGLVCGESKHLQVLWLFISEFKFEIELIAKCFLSAVAGLY